MEKDVRSVLAAMIGCKAKQLKAVFYSHDQEGEDVTVISDRGVCRIIEDWFSDSQVHQKPWDALTVIPVVGKIKDGFNFGFKRGTKVIITSVLPE